MLPSHLENTESTPLIMGKLKERGYHPLRQENENKILQIFLGTGFLLVILIISILISHLFQEINIPSYNFEGQLDYSVTDVPASERHVLNATIMSGYLTFWNRSAEEKLYVGETASAIQHVIDAYFPKPIKKLYDGANVYDNMWINSDSQILSYMTLIGSYIADTPLILPSRFILVMENASLSAPWNFSNTANHLNVTGSALVIIRNAELSGIVSSSGSQNALLSCENINRNYYVDNPRPIPSYNYALNSIGYTGPDGIVNHILRCTTFFFLIIHFPSRYHRCVFAKYLNR